MKKKILFILLPIGALVLFLSMFVVYIKSVGHVTMDLYGTSTDADTLGIERALLFVREKFDGRVDIRIHYIAQKDANNNVVSLQASTDQQADTTAVSRLDIEENERRLTLQKYFPRYFWDYLSIRDTSDLSLAWEEAARYADMPIEQIIEKTQEKGRGLLLGEIDGAEQLRSTQDITRLPVLLVNQTVYRAGTDVLSLSAAVAQVIQEQRRSHWWYRLMNMVSPALFSPSRPIQGVSACYADSDCDDFSDKYGTCAKDDLQRAVCRYADASEVTMFVAHPGETYDAQSDTLLPALQQTIKQLTVYDWPASSPEIKEIFGNLPLNSIHYVFDRSIESFPMFSKFKEQGLLRQLNEKYYEVIYEQK